MGPSKAEGNEAEQGVVVDRLKYAFAGCPPFIEDFSLKLPPGSRCLLLGCNGAGAGLAREELARFEHWACLDGNSSKQAARVSSITP